MDAALPSTLARDQYVTLAGYSCRLGVFARFQEQHVCCLSVLVERAVLVSEDFECKQEQRTRSRETLDETLDKSERVSLTWLCKANQVHLNSRSQVALPSRLCVRVESSKPLDRQLTTATGREERRYDSRGKHLMCLVRRRLDLSGSSCSLSAAAIFVSYRLRRRTKREERRRGEASREHQREHQQVSRALHATSLSKSVVIAALMHQ